MNKESKMKAYFALEAFGDCGHEIIFLSFDKKEAQLKFVEKYGHLYEGPPDAWPVDIIEEIEETSFNTDKDQAWFHEVEIPCPTTP